MGTTKATGTVPPTTPAGIATTLPPIVYSTSPGATTAVGLCSPPSPILFSGLLAVAVPFHRHGCVYSAAFPVLFCSLLFFLLFLVFVCFL